ncbi:hypothetical protein BN874_1750001 [Candidatus Contendobacter odensis Run_B_J11]|uniref:Methyl-accepting chemotaxis protein n=1 Tax=Candidatus Contendobacter odensis Run_B_J11 TaxID=1400861 RepID=A0A7U7GB76_9GAMM|nr:hypothetical protein BN874_1750001 [Candidatus Contendobacter odensis Run_B_J11]
MDQVTQQNAALVEQTAAASHAMGDQAQELQNLMGFFTLDEHGGTTSRIATASRSAAGPGTHSGASAKPALSKPRSVAKLHSGTRPAPAPSQPAARRTPVERKPTTTASSSEEWEEF